MDQEDLRRCADMSTAERRLACFESLLDGPPPAAAEAPPAAKAPPSAAVPVVEEAAPAAVETAMAEAAPVTEPATTPQPGNDFGRKYVKDDDDEARQDVTITVNEVTLDRYKRLHFQFVNGQVWRQLEARRFQYPKNEPFDVVISRGVLGDYQLRVGGEGRMTRIKRVK